MGDLRRLACRSCILYVSQRYILSWIWGRIRIWIGGPASRQLRNQVGRTDGSYGADPLVVVSRTASTRYCLHQFRAGIVALYRYVVAIQCSPACCEGRPPSEIHTLTCCHSHQARPWAGLLGAGPTAGAVAGDADAQLSSVSFRPCCFTMLPFLRGPHRGYPASIPRRRYPNPPWGLYRCDPSGGSTCVGDTTL